MNKRQKFIASCCNPLYDGFSTREEVKTTKLLARGKYWVEDLNFGCNSSSEDHDTFCAYSPKGKREFFFFDLGSASKELLKSKVRKVCRLWCKGECKKAHKLYTEILKKYG